MGLTMPADNQPYAASCNPPRRVKHPGVPSSSTTAATSTSSRSAAAQRTILPSPSSSEGSEFDPTPAPVPAKRGRKPGPLSRAARETQRKLNHSIIEKARRTKINEALASLRQLVPADYGHTPHEPEEDEEGGEGENGKRKDGKKGKKEEKEKEFKLEILVRTVSFLQDLLTRVDVLEAGASANGCAKCTLPFPSTSASTSTPNGEEISEPREEVSKKRKRFIDSSLPISDSELNNHRAAKRTATEASSRSSRHTHERLPSISSWLPYPDSNIDPQLLDSPSQFGLTGGVSGLPSPPSSTQFVPQSQSFHAGAVPTLHLGASSLPSSVPALPPFSLIKQPSSSPSSSYRTPLLSPLRTPEDESAASLLLQISGASPIMTPGVAFDMSRMRTGCVTPVTGGVGGGGGVPIQAQTPGSMLGLVGRRG
ncbi:hypothetical protein DXG01_005532 [Tephrocybe rancida]|nr:hypothetical protein DXG01_005532 [Tephrocybe rancida]